MFEIAKQHLHDVIEIADKCPEKYQEKCFEVLLESLVSVKSITPVTEAVPGVTSLQGIPLAASTFFSQNDIAREQWERIFHFDGNVCNVIVQDLKGKSLSVKQIRLALLLGMKNQFVTGTSSISKDELINMCKQYATYDSGNFAIHMKNQKNLFLPKENKSWELTRPGYKKAAQVIKELAQ